MAHRVFFFFARHAEIEIGSVAMEDGVIAKSRISMGRRENMAFAFPFEV